jgi:beta-xylosidase
MDETNKNNKEDNQIKVEAVIIKEGTTKENRCYSKETLEQIQYKFKDLPITDSNNKQVGTVIDSEILYDKEGRPYISSYMKFEDDKILNLNSRPNIIISCEYEK